MSISHLKSSNPDHFSPPSDDEEPFTLQEDWTKEEEVKAKRK